MSELRKLKAQARLDLHNAMQVEAFFYASVDPNKGTADLTQLPRLISVRIHTTFSEIPLRSGSKDLSAHFKDTTPKIVFLAAQVPKPIRGSLVSVAPGELYRVEAADPRDGLTIKATVKRVLDGAPEHQLVMWPTGLGDGR